MSFISLFENAIVQAFSLLIFIFLIFYVGFIILKKIVPDWKKRLSNYDEDEKIDLRCTNLSTHNFKEIKKGERCVWCNKSIEELLG